MKAILKLKKQDIPNLDKIKRLFKQGVTIRSLSAYFGIPYASLYRALKGRKKKKKNG